MSLLEEDKQIEIIFSFYSELVYLVSNTIEIIEKDISRDNDIKTDKAKAKAILTNILKLMLLSRAALFYKSLIEITNGNTSNMEREIYGFELNRLVEEYGANIYDSLHKVIKYIDIDQTEIKSQDNPLSYFIDSVDKNNATKSEDVLDYLANLKVIPEDLVVGLRDKAMQIEKSYYSMKSKINQKNIRLYSKAKVRLASSSKFKLSDYFISTEKALVVISSDYSKIAPLNMNNADLIYFIDIDGNHAYRQKIEQNIVKITSEKPVRIKYFLSNYSTEKDSFNILDANRMIIQTFSDIGKNLVDDMMQYLVLNKDEIADRIVDLNITNKIRNNLKDNGKVFKVQISEDNDYLIINSENMNFVSVFRHNK